MTDNSKSIEERLNSLENAIIECKRTVKLAKWLCIGLLVLSAVGVIFTFAYHRAKIAALTASIEKLDGRLAGWEGRGFHPAQNVPQQGRFVSSRDNRITLDVVKDGKTATRTFSINPLQVTMLTNLATGETVIFTTAEDDPSTVRIVGIVSKTP